MNIKPLLAAIVFFAAALNISGQTDPGTDNLLHQWTFDGGTADDLVQTNPVHGVPEGGASIVNNALKLSGPGQYLSLPGASLAINSYQAISQEIWFTPQMGANTGYTMLTYFGSTSGGMGYNYISLSAARGDDVSRTAISNGTYNSEIGANGPEYDDGQLHHMVSIVNADSILLYIDGELVSKTKNTIRINTVSNSLALVGKGGYSSDPTWIGSISKLSIYNKTLNANEVLYLFQEGPEQSSLITASKSALSFDEFYISETFTVSGVNLSDSIKISAPTGISIIPEKLAPDVSNATVSVFYGVSTTVDGTIGLSSGEASLEIPVKSYSNNCFSSLYPGVTNLIPNPYISSINYFSGWGSRSINSDPAFVFCGATSGMVTGTNAGSLDVSLTGKLMPNTTYRIKAKVFTIGGSFQIGVFGWSAGQSDYVKTFSTNNTWLDVDFTFTTGTALGSSTGIFFNNYGLSGTTGYIDNWEMYAIPKVYTSSSYIDFKTRETKKIAVRAVSLKESIDITCPAGFVVTPTTLSATVNGDSISIEFNGDANSEGYIYFTSGIYADSIYVKGNINPLLVSSSSFILVDEINNTATFTISGYNLSERITVTSPDGITVNPNNLPQDAQNTCVTLTYNGVTNSSGNLILTSGSATLHIALIAQRNDSCFTPLYANATNLITDATCNYYTADGTGNQGINTDPNYVYCGSLSGKITSNGSFNRDLTGLLKPETEYRMRALVYKLSPVTGNNMGKVTYTLAMDSASNPTHYNLIKTAMDSACGYFNKYTPFIENIYVYYNSGIPTAQASYHGSIGFGSNTRYMWVGTAIHEMAHYFGSGTSDAWHALMVNGVWTGPSANELIKSINGGVIHGDAQHYWPYGINQKEEITDLGSQAAQAKALADAVRIIKAMLVDDSKLPTNNPKVGIGVYGWKTLADDIYQEIQLSNSWQPIDFTFTTGSSLKATQKIYFNEGNGYIDNWELYEVPGIKADERHTNSITHAYIQQNNLVIEVEPSKNANMQIGIYDLQGKLMFQTYKYCMSGKTKITIPVNLTQGCYIVRINDGEMPVSIKVINW